MSMTTKQVNDRIRRLCGLTEITNPFFNDKDLKIILGKIGFTKQRLPKWWRKTKAGANHPGKENHLAILKALEGIEAQKQTSVRKAKKEHKFKTLRDVSQWVLELIAHRCPPNLNAFDIKENESNWIISLEIKK